MGYVALYVVAEQGSRNVRIGTATDLQNIFQQAQSWNCRPIEVHGIIWTPGRIYADDLEAAAHKLLGPYLMRGKWYEYDPEMVVNSIAIEAQKLRIKIFNDHRRWEMIEAECARKERDRGLLTKSRSQQVVMPERRTAEVIPMDRTRR